MSPRTPHPSKREGESQAKEGELERKKAMAVRVAAGEGLREVARAAGRANGARAPEEAVHLFQSPGFYIKANPPLGRPILPPRPQKAPVEAEGSPLGSPG